MQQRNEELIHQAKLLLDLYGDQQAQKLHLLRIEKELKRRGVVGSALYHQIEALCIDDTEDATEYRCVYKLHAPEEQQASACHPEMAEQLFDLTH